jgi:acyl-CoA reductase-like NAD-dependent aldehyde dehydrogenase
MGLIKRKPATDEQLTKAAEISDTDVDKARATWKKDAQPKLKNLLDADKAES